MARWWGRAGRTSTGSDESASVRAAVAASDLQWLRQFGSRTGSTWAGEVFAHALTDGRYDAAHLRERIAAGDAVDPDVLVRYVRMLAFSRRPPHDLLTPLLDHLAEQARTSRPRITPNRWRVLAQVFAGARRYADVLAAMDHWPETPANKVLRRLLRADVANPWRGGADGPHDRALWDELVASVYRDAGLGEVRVEERPGLTPFDGLVADSAPVDSPASVTVLMSCFKPDETTLAAVGSIVRQTWTDWELLVLDDASGPEYAGVLDEIAALDDRIRVVRAGTNQGTYVRRNDGLALASGEFVTMHDSDDWAHPQRLEVQMRHLLAHPDLVGNWIPCLRADEQLRFATGANGRLAYLEAEAALLFRREAVVERIGFYDPVRRAADREYRLRLEAAFDTEVPLLETGAPLTLCRVSGSSLSSPDFGGHWIHPARLAYRGGFTHWHGRIAAGEVPARLERDAEQRAFRAPGWIVDGSAAEVDVDVLVLLDLRPEANPPGLLDTVTAEVEALVAAGRRVGIAHLESLAETTAQGVLPTRLQALVDQDRIDQVLLDGDTTRAGRVVLRTATAAQGQVVTRLPVTTSEVVVVEDRRSGRDVRATTFAQHDVGEVVAAWFDAPVRWVLLKRRGDDAEALAYGPVDGAGS